MLSTKFLAQLEQLRIQCKQPFRGKYRGDRRSLNRGTGVEFADYRQYEHGDDLRYLDWNIYARLDKLFIKMFQTDQELVVSILIDTSQSMKYGEPTKIDYGKRIAAALAYIALANSDRVALYSFADRLTSILPITYGKAQYHRIQKAINTIESDGTTRITESLKQFALSQQKTGVVIMLSDFLDTAGYTKGINSLIGRGFDLTMIQIQCPEEINPPPQGEWQFEDAETGETKEITINEETITHYEKQQRDYCESIHNYCKQRGIGYVRINTDDGFEPLILNNLQRIGFIKRKY